MAASKPARLKVKFLDGPGDEKKRESLLEALLLTSYERGGTVTFAIGAIILGLIYWVSR